MNTNEGTWNIFERIGRKNKTAAMLILVVGILASVIISIILFVKAGEVKDYSYYDFTSTTSKLSGTLTVCGFVVLIGGSISSVLYAFLFYGIGTIVDAVVNTESSNLNTGNLIKENIESIETTGWECEKCGSHNNGLYCMNCGTKKPDAQPLNKKEENIWYCPDCGSKHQNYVGTCGCGRRKPI